MKQVSIFAFLVLAIYGLSGCASTTDTATAKGDPVPGEKTGDDQRLAPGTGMPGSASVRW